MEPYKAGDILVYQMDGKFFYVMILKQTEEPEYYYEDMFYYDVYFFNKGEISKELCYRKNKTGDYQKVNLENLQFQKMWFIDDI